MKQLICKGLDEAALITFAESFSEHLQEPLVIFLHGQLGAGKTTFSRGLIRRLGINGAIKSPTYTLLEEYKARWPVLHFDLYRLEEPEELEYLGIRDYLTTPALWLVEWAEKAQGLLPTPDIEIKLSVKQAVRDISVDFHTAKAISLYHAME